MITARVPGNFGLGAGIGPGTLNCPGDPGCPGNPIPATPIATLNWWDTIGTDIGSMVGAQLAANPPALASGGFSAWFMQNQNAVLWGLAILVGISFLGEGRR